MPREMISGQGHKIIQISLPPAGQQDNSNVLPQGPRRSIKSLSYSWSPPCRLDIARCILYSGKSNIVGFESEYKLIVLLLFL